MCLQRQVSARRHVQDYDLGFYNCLAVGEINHPKVSRLQWDASHVRDLVFQGIAHFEIGRRQCLQLEVAEGGRMPRQRGSHFEHWGWIDRDVSAISLNGLKVIDPRFLELT